MRMKDVDVERVRALIAGGADWWDVRDATGAPYSQLVHWAKFHNIALTAAGIDRAKQRQKSKREKYSREQIEQRKERAIRSAEVKHTQTAAEARKRLAELIAEGQALAGKGKRIHGGIVERAPMVTDQSRCWPSASQLG